MGMVDHPNIVRVEEYYECNGLVFIVMELMEGGELFDRLVEVEHYTEKQAVEAFRPLADAIRYCHSMGIVHRDLKPENLLYKTKDEDSLLKVSDFGFSKFLIPKAQEQLFTACGTPTYVAPEIIGNFGYDAKVDCWSLGVILYVMLCGYPPFYAEENNELFQLIKDCDYEFHMPYWENISDDAKDLIKKLLIADPKKRLSAEEILKHPWITQQKHSSNQLQIKTDFIMKRKLRTAINATRVIQTLQKQIKSKNQ
jgi:calcium/calmodulin-dependent protein kinase I